VVTAPIGKPVEVQALEFGGLQYQVPVHPYASRVVNIVERKLLTLLGLLRGQRNTSAQHQPWDSRASW
jgi:hypothetical protein